MKGLHLDGGVKQSSRRKAKCSLHWEFFWAMSVCAFLQNAGCSCHFLFLQFAIRAFTYIYYAIGGVKEQSVLINSRYKITVTAEGNKNKDAILDAVCMIALTLQLFWCGNLKAQVVLLKSWREFLRSAIPSWTGFRDKKPILATH